MSLAASIPLDTLIGKTLSVLCIMASVLTALGPLPTIRKIYKLKSTEEYPTLPYFSLLLCTALWLSYGFLVEDLTIIISNIVGFFLAVGYLLIFIYNSKQEQHSSIKKLSFGLLILIGFVLLAFQQRLSFEIGIAAVILFIFFLVSPLSVLMKVIKTKSCASLPFELPCAVFLNGVSYCLYGYLVVDDFSLWFTGFMTMLLAALQLFCHFIYGDFFGSLRSLCCICSSLKPETTENEDKTSENQAEDKCVPVIHYTNAVTLV